MYTCVIAKRDTWQSVDKFDKEKLWNIPIIEAGWYDKSFVMIRTFRLVWTRTLEHFD